MYLADVKVGSHNRVKSSITFSMQSTHRHVNAISDWPMGNGDDTTPFSQQSVVLTKQAYIELKWQARSFLLPKGI